MSELVRKADIAQYQRPAMAEEARNAAGGISVRLLNATPDPLGSLAALVAQYSGRVVRDLNEVTDEERRQALTDMTKTVLNGPLEVVQFHWQIEGVTRSITHQMVRSRASFFAQESLRFAVASDWAHEVPLPPSLAGAPDSLEARLWRKAMVQAEDSYSALVAAGVPAEEARGVLPHDIPTRLHWVMDLRTLLADAGKRTCTQAQFPWRIIFAQMAKELRTYRARTGSTSTDTRDWIDDGWQFRLMADMLRPVCYQTGSCGFMAKFDRGCSIRGRVDAFAKVGVPSSQWPLGYWDGESDGDKAISPIQDHEWAADPGAARVYEKNKQEPCGICSGYGCPECSDEEVGPDGCYVLPNGECISTVPCLHTPLDNKEDGSA